MEIIRFKEANCKSCYKCIRNCEVKAIKFSNEQAVILDNECILCGKCIEVCPQHTKVINSDLDKVKELIDNGEKLYASVAPSFISEFKGVSFGAFSDALKRLGFTAVEETAIGATKVSDEYVKLIKENKMKNIITSCCPTVNLLIEKYYPDLVRYLAPVVTPMTAHALSLKKAYGKNIKVVFIGPCISKKYEASLLDNVDNVLLFDEVKLWLESMNISIDKEDQEKTEMHNTVSRFYPVPSGIIKTIPEQYKKDYNFYGIDGLNKCIETLDAMRNGDINNYFIEMNSCAGSCIKGPGMTKPTTSFFMARDLVIENARKNNDTLQLTETEMIVPDMHKEFTLTMTRDKVPDEDTIASILGSIGKNSEKDMLNCGACGYKTCRDKAIAVFQGKADLKMCIPYMREKAESMSNIILENTPDAIFVTDKEFNVIEYNPSAKKIFSKIDENTVGMPIELLITSDEFDIVRKEGDNIYYAQCNDVTGELYLDLSIIKAPNKDYIVIVKDITSEKKRIMELEEIREHTLETTQKVIDKQMRVAQEIASLLGETTGETKAALTKLKKSIAQTN